MKKNILTLVALLSFATFVSAQDAVLPASETTGETAAAKATKFGYFSYNETMKEMSEYAIAMKNLEELKVSYDKELTRAEKDFSKKFAEFVDGQKSFPENIMLKRQKELQQLMEQSLQFKKEAQDLLAKAEKDVMAPIHERLAAAIKAVGAENGYIYILNTDANAYPYISGEAEDCTDKILEKLNAQ